MPGAANSNANGEWSGAATNALAQVGGLRYDPRLAMHYPHRISRIKKVRAIGFRARMSTRKGRKIINRKRRVGRRIALR